MSRSESNQKPEIDAEEAELRTRQREVLQRLADIVSKRGLATPAIFTLEAGKPLSFIGSQAMLFFEPFIDAFGKSGDYRLAAEGLEDRENIEWLIQQLEHAEEERGNSRATKS